MARLVFPQALGKAAAMYVVRPFGSSMPTINMCSANHPSWRPMKLPMRKAKHFLPSKALPP